jgi:hypothetical protein
MNLLMTYSVTIPPYAYGFLHILTSYSSIRNISSTMPQTAIIDTWQAHNTSALHTGGKEMRVVERYKTGDHVDTIVKYDHDTNEYQVTIWTLNNRIDTYYTSDKTDAIITAKKARE